MSSDEAMKASDIGLILSDLNHGETSASRYNYLGSSQMIQKECSAFATLILHHVGCRMAKWSDRQLSIVVAKWLDGRLIYQAIKWFGLTSV